MAVEWLRHRSSLRRYRDHGVWRGRVVLPVEDPSFAISQERKCHQSRQAEHVSFCVLNNDVLLKIFYQTPSSQSEFQLFKKKFCLQHLKYFQIQRRRFNCSDRVHGSSNRSDRKTCQWEGVFVSNQKS
jgi:hypothetical protein